MWQEPLPPAEEDIDSEPMAWGEYVYSRLPLTFSSDSPHSDDIDDSQSHHLVDPLSPHHLVGSVGVGGVGGSEEDAVGNGVGVGVGVSVGVDVGVVGEGVDVEELGMDDYVGARSAVVPVTTSVDEGVGSKGLRSSNHDDAVEFRPGETGGVEAEGFIEGHDELHSLMDY